MHDGRNPMKMHRFGIAIMFIMMIIDNGECVDESTTPRIEKDEEVHTRFHTSQADIDNYYRNDIYSKYSPLGRAKGEVLACCRYFSYFVHGRIYKPFQDEVFDGLIKDQQTGKQLVVSHYPDIRSTKNALVKTMKEYLTSLGEMNVKPCVLNYTYPLNSTDGSCASGKSLSCDQQCSFQCPQGYTLSNTKPITCCDKGQFTSTIPSCQDIQNPTISGCPRTQTAVLPAGLNTVTVSWRAPTATDNAGKPTLTCDRNPGSHFPLGQTLVTYIARDSSGNIATCSFIVIVTSQPTTERVNTVHTGTTTSRTILTDGHPVTTNTPTPTDSVSTGAPKYSARGNRKFLGFISLAALFIFIPFIYCVLKKNPYFPLDNNSSVPTKGDKDLQPDGRGSYTIHNVRAANPSPTQLDSKVNYKMDEREKGLIYILNNKTFVLSKGKESEIHEREGSDIDLENVKHVFEQIGYKAVVKTNLTVEGIRQSLKDLKEQIKPNHPSIVLMLMSHGDEEGIKGVNYRGSITIEEIIHEFSGQNCSVLIEKPKIIFVQACRGGAAMKQVKSDESQGSEPSPSPDPKSSLESDDSTSQDIESNIGHVGRKIVTDASGPDLAHYFIAHSTTKGYYSLRDTFEGSCFIQALCEELIKKVHKETLDSIMESVTGRVQSRVMRYKGREILQVPTITKQGVDKEIYFLPKYPQ